MVQKYPLIGMGGTFDHFHRGHESFLRFANQLSDVILIGITTDHLVRDKMHVVTLEPYASRYQSVATFCEQHLIPYQIVPLTDPYGPTLQGSLVAALAVTEETVTGGEAINHQRHALGLSALPIHICPLVTDEQGQPIHSVRIRAGEVSREGVVYEGLFKSNLTLLPDQKAFFSQPQGVRVVPTQLDRTASPIMVVGDSTLEYFIENNLPYDLGVYDQRRNRQVVSNTVIDAIKPELTTTNTAGTISVQLIKSLHTCLDKNFTHLRVEGEEDLATVALVLMAPLGARVYYGQPDQGIICITITEAIKNSFHVALNPSRHS